jgi:hypothetical protein
MHGSAAPPADRSTPMADAEKALHDEMEKVRERDRLQAMSQGLAPDAARAAGDAAVEEFCAKWGIRPEMLAVGGRPARAPAPAPEPKKPEMRTVDLGSSPLRFSTNPNTTQAIRIADLLKKAKEMEAPAEPAAPPAAPDFAKTSAAPNLSALLQRLRTQGSPASPTGATSTAMPAPGAAPARTAAPGAFPTVPAAAAPTTPARPYLPPAPAPAPVAAAARPATVEISSAGTLTGQAEKRRALLEEFDRTYAEVQSMLEQRIGVVDIAMNDASRGLQGAIQKAAADNLSEPDLVRLARDVERLRSNLQGMLGLCEELLGQLAVATTKAAGGGKA